MLRSAFADDEFGSNIVQDTSVITKDHDAPGRGATRCSRSRSRGATNYGDRVVESRETSEARSARRRRSLAPPADLLSAPGYGARRLYQAYLAAWTRHVDAVLTGPQFAVLSAIRAHPEADQGSLAGAVALDTSTMADVCRRLERRGLISRRESPSDARAKVLSLTDEGAAALAEVNDRARALDRALLAHCPPAERPEVAELLNRLGEQWEAVAELEDLPGR